MSAHASLSNNVHRPAISNSEREMGVMDKRQRQCHRAVTWLDMDDHGTQTQTSFVRPTQRQPSTSDIVMQPDNGKF